MLRSFFTLLLLTSIFSLSAQSDERSFNKIAFWDIALGYGIEQPIGDLNKRFGYNLDVIGHVEYTTGENLILGITVEQKFGTKVKENIFADLYTSKGRLLGANNRLSDAYLRMRGNYVGVHIGKIFKLGRHRSGIRCTLGAGITSHHIRIVDQSNTLPQINGKYITGYDRLTRGLAIKEYIGYQHISQDRLVNFTIGLDMMQAFTRPIRKYNFGSSQATPKSSRFDGYIGIKAIWILPFYQDYQAEEIFY